MPERIITSAMEIKYLVLMILAWASRLAFQSGLTVGIIARQLIISVFVGFIAVEYVMTQDFQDWIKVAVFCSVVFLADDILVIVLAFGKHLKDNEASLFKKITKFLSGG